MWNGKIEGQREKWTRERERDGDKRREREWVLSFMPIIIVRSVYKRVRCRMKKCLLRNKVRCKNEGEKNKKTMSRQCEKEIYTRSLNEKEYIHRHTDIHCYSIYKIDKYVCPETEKWFFILYFFFLHCNVKPAPCTLYTHTVCGYYLSSLFLLHCKWQLNIRLSLSHAHTHWYTHTLTHRQNVRQFREISRKIWRIGMDFHRISIFTLVFNQMFPFQNWNTFENGRNGGDASVAHWRVDSFVKRLLDLYTFIHM